MARMPKVHYQRPGNQPACGTRRPLPWDELTGNLLLITCGRCMRTTRYRDDLAATLRAIRHDMAGQAVLNPEFLPGGTA